MVHTEPLVGSWDDSPKGCWGIHPLSSEICQLPLDGHYTHKRKHPNGVELECWENALLNPYPAFPPCSINWDARTIFCPGCGCTGSLTPMFIASNCVEVGEEFRRNHSACNKARGPAITK